MRGAVVASVAVVLVGAAFGASPGWAQTGYDVSVSPAVDTPERTVEFDGDTYTVADIGRVDPGETLSATVSAPDDDLYDVLLYDADRQIVDSSGATDASSVDFPTSHGDGETYEPGSYVVAVSHDGSFQVVHPVVISGYRASVDAPASAEPGAEITVEATVTTIDDAEPIDRVQVVIGNDDERQQVQLSSDGGGDYSATFAVDSLSTGEHSLYVVVQGAEQVFGKQEVLGVSDARAFTVGSGDSSDGGSSSDGSDGSGGGGGSGGQESAPTTEASTASPTDTPETTDATGTDGSTPTAATARSTSAAPTDAGTTTADPVITPNSPAATTTTSPGQALGVLPPLLALLVASVLARRRR